VNLLKNKRVPATKKHDFADDLDVDDDEDTVSFELTPRISPAKRTARKKI